MMATYDHKIFVLFKMDISQSNTVVLVVRQKTGNGNVRVREQTRRVVGTVHLILLAR